MAEYLERFYREQVAAADLVGFEVRVAETDLLIWAARDLAAEATDAVRRYRGELEDFIARQPLFRTSLKPYDVPKDAPDIVRIMAEEAARVDVGPMAAVAGAIAESVGRDLIRLDSPEVIVENGGDIWLASARERRIGIFAGPSPFSGKLALQVPAVPEGFGICTSSATVGPSLSFGRADAAVVLAPSAALADAAASALGNRVKKPEDIESALDWAASIPEIAGCLVIIGEHMGVRGDINLAKLG